MSLAASSQFQQLMLAAHSNGKISLINTNEVAGRRPSRATANFGTAPAKIEKVFVTAGMV